MPSESQSRVIGAEIKGGTGNYEDSGAGAPLPEGVQAEGIQEGFPGEVGTHLLEAWLGGRRALQAGLVGSVGCLLPPPGGLVGRGW